MLEGQVFTGPRMGATTGKKCINPQWASVISQWEVKQTAFS